MAKWPKKERTVIENCQGQVKRKAKYFREVECKKERIFRLGSF